MRIAIELFLSSVRAGTAPCSRASVTRFTRSEDEGWEALELAGGVLKRGARAVMCGTRQPRCACERRGGKAGARHACGRVSGRDQFLVEAIGSRWCGRTGRHAGRTGAINYGGRVMGRGSPRWMPRGIRGTPLHGSGSTASLLLRATYKTFFFDWTNPCVFCWLSASESRGIRKRSCRRRRSACSFSAMVRRRTFGKCMPNAVVRSELPRK
jgi:hypothetical protein